MTTTTLTLATFLEARLAEDGAMANQSVQVGAEGSRLISFGSPDAPPVMVVHPARVLAEVAAKRAVLAACEDERQRKDIYNRGYDEGLLTTDGDRRSRLSSNARWAGLDVAVRYMVQVYSHHADFRPEWLPENW